MIFYDAWLILDSHPPDNRNVVQADKRQLQIARSPMFGSSPSHIKQLNT
jgi:hypothetical protein